MQRAGWEHRIPRPAVRAIPKALLSLNAASCPRALPLQGPWLRFGGFHPFATFLPRHRAYRQVVLPVNLLWFPRVTVWISNRKNTKSPICFFITQRIHTKWGSLLSCRTGKPPHYSASNTHLLRVNKSSVWLSLCKEWPPIRGSLSLRKRRNRTYSYFIHGSESQGGKNPKIYRHRATPNKQAHTFFLRMTPSDSRTLRGWFTYTMVTPPLPFQPASLIAKPEPRNISPHPTAKKGLRFIKA